MKRILIAEHNESDRAELKEVFENMGFSVQVVSTQDEMMSRIDGEKFDAFILELLLPGRDNLDLIRQIKEKNQTVPLLTIADEDSLALEKSARENGAESYFSKPIEMERLKEMVKSLVTL